MKRPSTDYQLKDDGPLSNTPSICLVTRKERTFAPKPKSNDYAFRASPSPNRPLKAKGCVELQIELIKGFYFTESRELYLEAKRTSRVGIPSSHANVEERKSLNSGDDLQDPACLCTLMVKMGT
jgi:hypothetical protein